MACNPEPDDGDTDRDTEESGADTDPHVDTDTAASDTGVAAIYYTGDFQSDGATGSGHFGLSALGGRLGDYNCVFEGEVTSEGDAPAGCPSCDWAFTFTPVSDSIALGAQCEDYLWEDGGLDGAFAFPWGFTAIYYYDYAGTPLPLENTLMLYGSEGWFAFAFNYPGNYIYQTSGDASALEFTRTAYDSSGDPVYYYYYL